MGSGRINFAECQSFTHARLKSRREIMALAPGEGVDTERRRGRCRGQSGERCLRARDIQA
eukprot:3416588-Pleurochrysis_carterae.AAC.1